MATEGLPRPRGQLLQPSIGEVHIAVGKALEDLQFYVTTELSRMKDLLDMDRMPVPVGDTAVPEPQMTQRTAHSHLESARVPLDRGSRMSETPLSRQWTSERSRLQLELADASRVEEQQKGPRPRRSLTIAKRSVKEKTAKLVKSVYFDLFWIGVVVVNAALIGVQTQWAAKHLVQDTEPLAFTALQHTFSLMFVVELTLRLVGTGWRELLFGKNKMWTYLDCLIIVASLFEVLADAVLPTLASGSGGASSNLRTVRMFRLARVLRGLRIERLIYMVSGLRTLVFSIAVTLKSLMWAMLLLVIIMYIIGITLTEFVVDWLINAEDQSPVMVQQLHKHWRSLDVSMFTLFQSISGGLSWHEAAIPLEDINVVLSWIFTGYIGFTYFAVLNVVTGVFCNSAIESAQHTPEVIGQTMLSSRKAYVASLEKLFQRVDEDGTNDISYSEFEKIITDPDNNAILMALEIEAADAWTLFKLIDSDRDGVIQKNEFIEGCLQLKGMARNVELANLHHDVTRLERKLRRYMGRFAEIRDLLWKAVGTGKTLSMDSDQSEKG